MVVNLNLPVLGGALEPPLQLTAVPQITQKPVDWNRTAYSAAHVVCDPLADVDPWVNTAVDWDTTLGGFRQHLWDMGGLVSPKHGHRAAWHGGAGLAHIT